jgi:hypothetical protein
MSNRDSVDHIAAQWKREKPDAELLPTAIIGRITVLNQLIRPRLERVFAEYGINGWAFDVGNVILRYPLDVNFPGFHLAPYIFGGVGGVFNSNNALTRVATFGHAQTLNRRNTDNEVLGDGGLGLEYRFTPHIGLFSDVRYNVVDESKNNFLSTRIGLRFAF